MEENVMSTIDRIKEKCGNNLSRIPFEISGNHDDYIGFADHNGMRHMRVVKYYEKSFSSEKTYEIVKHLCLLGWDANDEHWGDKYYDASGEDKTDQLHHWIASNHPFDLFKGLMSDLKELTFDLNKCIRSIN
jgi:hypothetical protein|tara:strand:+ start:1386 stop:1781 length:396 start_codon:yes stop_codon:yes gene_type:complete